MISILRFFQQSKSATFPTLGNMPAHMHVDVGDRGMGLWERDTTFLGHKTLSRLGHSKLLSSFTFVFSFSFSFAN